ncbi:DODA-type extradiol aromatic ring-opening family dioxygenase [Bordetella tumulicola]|uniref:DODA-type extradiol aromatic ring-opening family dioxygenase n=1 Tax=Bordetella tumulicola TaxID=1649133 RepID=UPI0039F0427C
MSTSSPATSTMPVLFIPHGAGPCFFMDWNPPGTWDTMADFLKGVAATLPAKPKAIVMVSGHWLTQEGFRVTFGAQPPLIYDYYGFPQHTYELQYPAPGEPALAERVSGLLSQAGLSSNLDGERGFDHGMFIPLKLMFPEADIPVIQLSLRRDLDAQTHLAVGQALAPLRGEDILIVGSGMSFHNMRGFGDPRFTAPSESFDAWLTHAVETDAQQRYEALSHWAHGPHAYQCHPAGHEEHLIPLMVAAGAAGQDAGKKIFSGKALETQISAFRFG